MNRVLEIRRHPNEYKDDEETLAWLESLVP